MRLDLSGHGLQPAAGVRPFEQSDAPALGPLMYRAYLDTVDYDGETPELAAAEVAKTLDGAYGAFMPSCSMVATVARTPDGERDGASHGMHDRAIVSATLVTQLEGTPFVAFTFTDPAHGRRGLARDCMLAAITQLLAEGERELRLVVTRTNAPAIALYTRLGFTFEA